MVNTDDIANKSASPVTIASADATTANSRNGDRSLGSLQCGTSIEKIAKLAIASPYSMRGLAISSLKPPPLLQRDCHVATLLAMTEAAVVFRLARGVISPDRHSDRIQDSKSELNTNAETSTLVSITKFTGGLRYSAPTPQRPQHRTRLCHAPRA